MRRWVIVILFVMVAFAVTGFVLTYLPKVRRNADITVCQDHLRAITQFAAQNVNPQKSAASKKLLTEIPAGTILLPNIPPEERLSWVVAVIPGLDQRHQNTSQILSTIDPAKPWKADLNQKAGQFRLTTFLCPGIPPEIEGDLPFPTAYVGISGLGSDAASLAISMGSIPQRAGCFRYDSPTSFQLIMEHDGLSQSLMLGERAEEPGPWLRGGPSTVRGLDDAPNAKLLVGTGGQFGGYHPYGANWAFADGSARFLTDRGDPKVLFAMATIAGGVGDPIPGE